MRRSRAAVMVVAALGPACEVHAPPAPQAGIEEVAIDWSANPCNDFYRFACGNWQRWHPIPATNAVASRVGYVQDDQIGALFKIVIDDATGHFGHPDDHDATKIGDYYATCRAAAESDRSPPSSLTGQLSAIAVIDNAGLAAALARLHIDGVPGLFSRSIDRDPGNPTREILHLRDGGLSMYRDYYVDGDLSSYLAAYRTHVGALIDAAGATGLLVDVDAVLRIETALATAALPSDVARDPVATYNLTDVPGLKAAVPRFDWDGYLAAAGATAVAAVNVENPALLPVMNTLLSTTSLADVRAYLTWRAIEAAAPALGKSATNAEFSFHDRLFLGRASPLPDYWRCFIATLNALGFSVSRPFVAERFGAAQRDAAAAMMAAVRRAMADTIASRTWLDDPTRAAAADKLTALIANIGFPDVWPTADGIQIGRQSYFDNRIEIARARWRSALSRLGATPARGEWLAPPWVTNAYYSPDENSIAMLAGILQPPFFSADRPAAANYGSIGSVMGHELTHGFDDQGRRYDGQGTLRDWWTPAVGDEFSRRAACVANTFGAFTPLPNQHIDGTLTLGENLADLGGLKLAHAAFRAADGGNSAGPPGLLSPDQQFFVAFAQSWCENERTEYLADNLRTDPHSPGRYRVNGTVAHVAAFAEAFHCPAGAPLAPAERCEVW